MSLHSLTPSSRAGTSRLGFLALIPAFLFFLAARELMGGELPLLRSFEWAPSLGIDVDVYIDGLALQFILLITGIGAAVFVYAAGYLAADRERARLFVWLLVFMVAMLGSVSIDNLIVLYAFWELTSISSFMIIAFHHERTPSLDSARQAMIVTFGGGFVLLIGFLLLGELAGSYSIQRIIELSPSFADDPRFISAMFCLIVGAFTKSAQLPFHFWLPNAMAAPTPASAYLHSATMVKLGVYLLARFDIVYSDQQIWEYILVGVGGLTSVWAMFQTIFERDLKRILAWSTVSALGMMFMLIGLPGDESALAVSAYVLAHALYKAPLFFVAGNVDHCTGTRDIGRLSGLAPRLPWSAGGALLAALSMGGLPFSFGYFAKQLMAMADNPHELFQLAGYISVPVSAMTVAVAGIAAIRLFWRQGGARLPAEIQDGPFSMRLPPILIAGVGIVFGIRPDLAAPIIGAAAEGIRPNIYFDHLIYGEHDSSLLGLGAVFSLGAIVFVFWEKIHQFLDRYRLPENLRAAAHHERSMHQLVAFSSFLTRRLQNGRLTRYSLVLVAFFAALILMILALMPSSLEALPASIAADLQFEWSGAAAVLAFATFLIVASSIAITMVRDSFLVFLVSGLIGFGLALIFLFMGAPDLAMTQFTVEVVLVVVLASVLLRVRRLNLGAFRVNFSPLRALASVLVAGSLTTLILVTLLTTQPDPSLTEFVAQESSTSARASNVVNAILVDFRAIDTLGEITVLALTLLAAFPMLSRLRARRRKEQSS